MRNLRGLLFILTLSGILFNFTAHAEDGSEPDKKEVKSPQVKDASDFQKIVDEYKAYAATIDPKIRDEIIEYRKEIAKLNKQKRFLYRQLSQDSQEYLKREQGYKKKLPLQRKNLINLDDSNQETSGSSKE